ncbi:CpaF family protein [Flexivirga alba]|uniref:CpaF family protein n=1 Tax=Flexivirga alba TaxID=702742 RepID=A0ABW2AIU7_9MICO
MTQSNPWVSDPDDPTDPTSLPLFAGDDGADTDKPKTGRVRSSFSLGEESHDRPAYIHAVDQPRSDDDSTDAGRGRQAGRSARRRKTGANAHDGIDWGLVAAFRGQASEQLSAAIGKDRTLDEQAQEELGRSIILELLESEAAEAVSAGRQSWSLDQQDDMADAIFNALFRLGRFQPLVDDETVENIEAYGHDHVLLLHSDGRIEQGPPVAESDEELIEFLTFLGSKSGSGRPFSEAQPRLHINLPGGARLAAACWSTNRPTVVIRRHRVRDTDMRELAATGMLSDLQADFLEAAVKARLNIIVAGPQGAGKTTMVRGLCASIDPWEKIGTFETEYELFLDEMPRHKRVIAFESRPGSGEVGINGRQAGEVTLDDLLIDSFRFMLGRTIVGEVRGPEILSMIKAMQSTAGSISTTHAANAKAAIRKLVTCAMEAGAHISDGYAVSAVAGHIDLIVQLHYQPGAQEGTDQERRPQRWISEIVSVEPGEEATGYATQHVFRPKFGGPAVASVLPEHIRGVLEEHGFDTRAFENERRIHGGETS